MGNIDRRTFLFLGLGTLLSGCVGTYWSGSGEVVETQPFPPKAPVADPEPPLIPLGSPIYEDQSAWTPDLSPVGRRFWSLALPRLSRLRDMGRVWRVTIHHEGSPTPNSATTPREVARCLRRIQKVHMGQHGTGDIGYHYIIDRAGRIWEGRSRHYQGAHAGGSANRGNIGVMLLGNFDIQEPTSRQKAAVRSFTELLLSRYSLGGHALKTHRELKATRCPGENLQRYVQSFRPSL